MVRSNVEPRYHGLELADSRLGRLINALGRQQSELTGAHTRRPAGSEIIKFSSVLFVSRVGIGLLVNCLVQIASPYHAYAPGGRGGNVVTSLLRWDSGWYLGVANHWYPFKRSVVFFPGYPLLIRSIEAITLHHLPLDAAGLLVSWLSLAASIPLVCLIATRLDDRATGKLAALLYVWSPASVFLISAYPDGLFIALTSAALLCLQSRKYGVASLLAGLSTAVSPLGICTAIAVTIAVLRERRSAIRLATTTVVSLSGLIAWISWQSVRYGSPLLFLTEQKTFNRHTGVPFLYLVNVLSHLRAQPPGPITLDNFELTRIINAGFGLLVLGLSIYYLWIIARARHARFPLYFGLYAFLSFVLPAASTQTFVGVDNPEAVSRLSSDSVGLYPPLARSLRRHPYFGIPLVTLWFGLAILIEVIFVSGWYFT